MSSDPLPRSLAIAPAPPAAPALHLSGPALRVENVSKMYRLFSSRGDRLKEALSPFGKRYHKPFWALRDISVEVPRGQTVGILGMNGSGKSTLLQIIAGVLTPTTGRVVMEGRLAALLELGAGFNLDLSGRENVIMNSTIMGLTRKQIQSRIAEIEAFADIGDFFDQPVKTYSSGMFVRVAFAAAIHVDPEVLIVDEALSVGDARFQEKSYRKFSSFKEAGKTIIYVTHDRSSVLQLCDFAILLHQGELVEVGEPSAIVNLYSEILGFGDLRSVSRRRKAIAGLVPESAGEGKGPAVVTALHPGEPRLPPPQAEPGPEPQAPPPPAPVAPDATAAVAAWLSRRVGEDRCAENPTFNKDEHAWGDGRARIVDYLIVGNGQVNPLTIDSGTQLDIYLKVAFEADLAGPLVGIGVRTPKGVIAFSTHSGWAADSPNAPVKAGEVHAYRYRLTAALQSGPWFLQLAVAAEQDQMCQIRTNMALLEMTSATRFDGLTQLPCTFEALGPDPGGPATAPDAGSG